MMRKVSLFSNLIRNMSKVLELIIERRSIKNFNKNFKISSKDIIKIFETIRMSPTSFNLQPFKVYYVSNIDIREELSPICWNQDSITSSSGLLVWTVNKEDYLRNYYIKNQIRWLADGNDNRIERVTNGLKIVVDDRKIRYEEWAIRQCYITLGCIMPVIKELDLDSCPIEGFLTDKVNDVFNKHKVYNSKNETIALVCAIGKRLEEQNTNFLKNKKRLPMEDLFKTI
ncbi:nitroreductase family protein [Spiroplasma corruscae]|nr:nitroreductase family protein [Spiroplasma corruscae]